MMVFIVTIFNTARHPTATEDSLVPAAPVASSLPESEILGPVGTSAPAATEEVSPTTAPAAAALPITPPPTATSATGPSQLVERGTSGRREIALTFDGGAERGDAESILDILEEYDVVASFGVTAAWATANPDLVRRMVADGHMLFSHGTSHQSWTGYSTATNPAEPTTWRPLTREERTQDLEDAEKVIDDLVGVSLRPYFRPPYADYDSGVLELLGERGYPVTLMWSCESLAWMGMTAEELVDYCTTDMAPGDIILLHISDAGVDSAALPGLIEGLQGQGFTFVTADGILRP